MTLKEKIDNVIWESSNSEVVSKLQIVADDFAIGFAEWYFKKAEKYESHLKLIEDQRQLLEIYKKEKGL